MLNNETSRHRRKEARPGEILTAALAMFHEKGFAATRIDEVAQAAGVTKGTVYLYFESKEALFKAAILESVLPNLERIEEATLNEKTACARLKTALELWAGGMSLRRGSLFKLMIAEAGNFPELAEFFQEEVSGRVRRMLIDIIEFGIARHEFRPCNPALVVRALIAPVLMGDLWRRIYPKMNDTLPEPDHLIDSLMDIVFNGITPRAEISNENK